MDEILNFIWFWFDNPRKWFINNVQNDKEIVNTFGHLLKIIGICNDKPFNIIYYLGQILISDQLTRHYDRIHNSTLSSKYQKFAIECSQRVLQFDLQFQNLLPEQQCFILLPLRHSKNLELVTLCQKYVRELIDVNIGNVPNIYLSFIKANMDCLIELVKPIYYPPVKNLIWRESKGLLNPKCKFYIHHPIGINNELLGVDIPEDWKQYFINLIPRDKKIIISLSGGGDSMVCSYILKQLGYEVTALMIDYGNRDTSEEEVKFVHYWCSRIGINLYVHHMGKYLKRNNNERHSNVRTIYEDKTRKWRFKMYNIVSQRIGSDIPRVILGHNLDDGIENIVANLCKHQSFINLKGFKNMIVERGVEIYRPIKEVEKLHITQFADIINIPYLYDSTPPWSFRGRTRDEFVQSVNTFDPRFLKGLYHMAELMEKQSEAYHKILDESTNYEYSEEFVTKINKISKKVTITYIKNNYDESYWTHIFKTIHEYGFPMLGNSRIQKLIQEIMSKNIIDRTITKQVKIKLDPTETQFIVYSY